MRDNHARGFHEGMRELTKLQGGQGYTQNHGRNQHDAASLENALYIIYTYF